MPKILGNYVRFIESMNKHVGEKMQYAIFALIGILTFELIARYVFSASTPWSVEMAQYTLGAYFILGGAYVFLEGGHVSMDALYSKWSPKRRVITDLATFPLIAVYLVVFVWAGFNEAKYSFDLGQRSTSVWGPYLAPIKFIIVVGAFLILLQAIAFLIRDIAILKGKPIK